MSVAIVRVARENGAEKLERPVADVYVGIAAGLSPDDCLVLHIRGDARYDITGLIPAIEHALAKRKHVRGEQ